MPDIKIVKTNNVGKIKQQSNQLIFCKDGSIYFDYSDDLRLRNVGEGAQIVTFTEGNYYAKGDMVERDGNVYFFRGNPLYDPDPIQVKEFCVNDWVFMCRTSDSSGMRADEILFDRTYTQGWVDGATVQLAINEIVDILRNHIYNSDQYECLIGTFDDQAG